MGGSVNYYTHYAYTSAGSMTEAMQSAETLYSSDSFAEFSKEVDGNREIRNISIIQTVKTYNNNFNCHNISGTSYILHKNIINDFADLYKLYLEKLVDNKFVWTDQIILTYIYKDNKHLFYKLCEGYGENIPYLMEYNE